MTDDLKQVTPEIPGDIDPELQSLVWQAIKDRPLARTLADEEIFTISIEAIRAEKVNDSHWLQERIKLGEERSPHIPGSKIPKIIVSTPPVKPSLEQFAKIADEHDQWRESVLHPSKAIKAGRANFENSDLSGLVIDSRDLRGANFRGANLANTKLINCNLATCNLAEATITNSHWQGVSLRRVVLSQATIDSTIFDNIDLRAANLDQAKIKNCHFEGDIKGKELLPVAVSRSNEKPATETQ